MQIRHSDIITAILLITILLLSSIDSFGIDGVVPLIQTHYNISGADTAMIRTASSAVHTITLGLMWIFGDALERRKFYLVSVAAWIVFSLLSILLGSQSFMIFVVLRSVAAAFSAMFGVLSPVVLADLFRDRALGIVLMCMTASELVAGAFLSGIFSSFVVSSALPWQTGLLPGPILSLIPLAGLCCFIKKAQLNKAQKSRNAFAGAFRVLTIKSFVIMTAGLSLGAFHMRSQTFWMPSLFLSAWTKSPEVFLGLSYPSVISIKLFISLGALVVGMPLTLWFAQSWNHGTGLFSGRSGYGRAYPIVVGVGGFLGSAMFIIEVLIIGKSFAVSLIPLILYGISSSAEVCLSQQMLMMVLPSHSRAAAISLSRLISGIVATPAAQIIGIVSDTIIGDSTFEEDRLHAYKLAMLCSALFMIASACCYIILVFFFEMDCKRVETSEDAADECTYLIGDSKRRNDSILNSIVRSRAQTLESYY